MHLPISLYKFLSIILKIPFSVKGVPFMQLVASGGKTKFNFVVYFSHHLLSLCVY